MKQLKYFLLLSAILLATNSYAQNIGIGTTTPDSSAILDIKSTSKGLLIPRLTTAQRDSLKNTANSLLIYNKTLQAYQYLKSDTLSAPIITQLGGSTQLNNIAYSNIGGTFVGTTNQQNYYQQLAIQSYNTSIDTINLIATFVSNCDLYTPIISTIEVYQGLINDGIADALVGTLHTSISTNINGSIVHWIADESINISANLNYYFRCYVEGTNCSNGGSPQFTPGMNYIGDSPISQAGYLTTQANLSSSTPSRVVYFETISKLQTITTNIINNWQTFNSTSNQLAYANSTTNGLLTNTDWNTFNNKQNALSNANATTNGILTSADWNNFNSKSSFNLPSLTRGAMLFSNGSTLSQDASKLYWNDSTKHFGVGTNFPANTLTVNSTNNGTGTIDWIAGDFGGINGDRVVMGILEGEASIGAHNNSLNGWATLTVNPGGFVKIPSITNYWSSDNQMVTINQQGILGSQPMFQLPTLSTGSVLFSNGVSISQANSKLFWNNATNYLGIGTNNPNRTLTVSSTNNGTGTADWISGNFGAQSGDRVVIGTINSEATIGAHNEQLNSWDTLSLNGGATVKIPNLAGSGTRLVTADNAGHLSTIATVGNASAATTGYLTNTDWNRFNAAAIDTRKIDSGYNGLTKTNQQLTLGGNLIQQTNINMQSNDFIMQSGGGSSILAMNSSLNIGGGTEPAGYGIGQTFTASNTGTINYIKLYGYEIISYTYYLIQGNGLGGTVLATGSGNAYHTTPDAAYFNVSVNVPCIVGQQYTLLITTNGNLGLAYSSIAGNPKQYGDINYPSTWSSNPNQAIFFEVYETPSINTALAISGTNGSIRFGTLGNTNSANYLSTSSNGTVESKTFANASASSNGILTSTDWNVFNNKQNTLSNANSTTSGILTSTDWNTFNNKGSFDLPSLTSGSLLFSNGTTIAQNNSKVYWDNTNNRLGVGTNTPSATTEISGTSGLKISSTNPGSGTTDWIASNVGGTSGDRVVSGVLDGNATIGAHNNSLNAWSNLVINNTSATGATVTIGNNANTSPTIAAATTQTNSTQLNTKLVVNGSVRQGYYSTPISVAANSVTYVTWNHNLGYGPIVMMSTDQNGGGGYMDYCNVTTYNNNANQTIFVIRNLGGSNATGNLRWVLVW